ncbi:class II aldolase/adducin family protein [Olsenella sp. HMSC062G07]|uniref:class II aldolase/adducin family protein n=1 Tax=Olsenella sp. HMSC062G07 TaxID=1739330 RepID=UPI0009F67F28|nr:class II aldolase/adducin family protein [Olsenella sp. HMSC062G07]
MKQIFMSEKEARQAIVEVGRRMYGHGYVVTNDGNISVRISRSEIVVTPTGVSKGFMTPEMMVKMNLDGEVLDAKGTKPSSEVKMHLRVYAEDDNVTAVVHAHPIYATSYAIAGIPLDEPILSEAMLQIGAVPIAKYAKPGTYDVPDGIAAFVKGYGAVLLSNHGALTWGTTLGEAFSRMEVLENYAHISFVVGLLGGGRGLDAEQVAGLAGIRKEMGLAAISMPVGRQEKENGEDLIP